MEIKPKYFFITPIFEKEIRKVVYNEFPSLNDTELDQLGTYLSNIIELISNRFNFINILHSDEQQNINRGTYEHQLRQNGYTDIRGLLNMLLPFINDIDDKRDIRSLKQLYTDKKEGVTNINDTMPLYKFTNIQYGRCKRDNSGLKSEEISFDMKHLNDNYILLKETIHIVSHKLFVNWVDVLPIPNDVNIIKERSDYDMTNYRFKKNKIPMTYDTDNDYIGLYIGDIYNVLANYLYNDILEIKWLIYDMIIDGDTIISFIRVLARLLPIENLLNSVLYNQQSDDEKIKFDSHWRELVSTIDNNKDLGGISNSNLRLLIKVITTFFDSKYSLSNEMLNNGYKKLRLKEELDPDENDEVQLSRTTKYDKQVFISSKTINSEMIYNYLFYALTKFKKTWYGSKFIKKENEKIILSGSGTIYSYFTCKNIYNYAKSLTTFTKEVDVKTKKTKLYKFPRYWHTLSVDDKKEIHKRINWGTSNDVDKWWNIRGYMKYLGIDYNSSFQVLYESLREHIIEMIFSCLAFNGILSEFKPQKYLTDESLSSQHDDTKKQEKKERMKEYIFNDANSISWDNSHYFMTNSLYKDCPITYEKNKQEETDSYLKILSEGTGMGDWFSMYAVNWVAQIAFFHHYLNNSIIYVTGGTGVGKSTQVPKLLLYALKMIDYKQDGKIVCTVPRRPVAVENAKSISTQMGLPILGYNYSLKGDIDANNYYIQYQHQKKRHAKPNDGLTLNIVTDGLLLQQMLKNPLFKTKSYSESKKEYDYSKYNKNKYDIVIVDEAHEHNKNMDYILTFMKYALYYNNSLKLVIISATMDDDEPTYRRFYRDINDNRMYPLNKFIEENKLDRINIDRRIHISPPGMVTRFIITEKQRELDDPDQIVLEIARTTTSKDILLFRPGKREISESISKLNGALPPNFLALPFHGEMSEEKREPISKLATSKGIITYPRDLPYDQYIDEKLIKRVPEGTYNRVVIVATDIAEASLTIDTLGYVVETGIRKSAIYDYKTRNNVMKTTGISEASRLQRKGRVGRVDTGTVYYTYDIKRTVGEKKPFSVAISDISEDLFSFLRDNINEKPMFDQNNDPHKEIKLADLERNYPNGLHNMIKEQYFYKDSYFSYYGIDEYYDYNNNKSPHIRYQTGYSKKTLEDSDTSFYIIHPDEMYINRNINGVVVSLTNDASGVLLNGDNKITSLKILSFWDLLIEKICLINSNGDLIKTEFGQKLLTIRSKMTETPLNDITSYIYGRQYGVGNDILKVITAKLDPINGSPSLLGYNFDTIKAMFGNCKSDSYGFIKMLDSIYSYISRIEDVERHTTKLESVEHTTDYQKLKDDYLIAKTTGNYTNIGKGDVEKLLRLDHNNKISYNNKFSKEERKEFLKEDIGMMNIKEKTQHMLERWCNENGYNYANVDKLYQLYVTLVNDFMKYDDGIYDVDPDEKAEDVKFSWFDQRIKVDIQSDRADNITCSLLHGYGYNIVRRIEGSPLFVHIGNPTPDNVSKIDTKSNTFIKSDCMSNYLMYLIKNEEGISFIHNVTPNLIQSVVAFVYMPEKFSTEKYDLDSQNDMIKYLTDQFKLNTEQNPIIRQTLIKDYVSTIKKIKSDMINAFSRTPYYNILKLVGHKDYDRLIDSIINNQYSVKRNQSGGKSNLLNRESRLYATYILNKILK